MTSKQLQRLSFRLLKLAEQIQKVADKDPGLKDLAQGADNLWHQCYRLREERRLAELRAEEGSEVLYTIFEPSSPFRRGTAHKRTPGRIIRATFTSGDPHGHEQDATWEHTAEVVALQGGGYGAEIGRCWPVADLAAVRRRTDRTMPAWGKRFFAEVAA